MNRLSALGFGLWILSASVAGAQAVEWPTERAPRPLPPREVKFPPFLVKTLAKLQPELAEALMLYEVEGKSYAEIAGMLGIPIGTVRTRIFRAREFIAKRLEPVLEPQRGRRW